MNGRQPLHLDISSTSSYFQSSSHSSSSQSSPTTASTELSLFSVLCFYDFESDDPAHLSFRKNEILDIFQQEDTGWWAAMRRGGTTLGWIPMAFVKELSEEMTDKLLRVKEEIRVYEYEAEQLYEQPVARYNGLYEPPEPSPPITDTAAAASYSSTPPLKQNGYTRPVRPLPLAGPPPVSTTRELFSSSPHSAGIPPSPITPMPHPPPIFGSYDKPTPPTPRFDEDYGSPASNLYASPSSRAIRREPLRLDPRDTPPTFNGPVSLTGSIRGRSNKVLQLTGEDDAAGQHRAGSVAWNQLASYSDKLQTDGDTIRYATLHDLVVRLTHDSMAKDPIRLAAEKTFQDIFLTTFRTFTTADVLFAVLVQRFELTPPSDLDQEALSTWIEKVQLPIQSRILAVFQTWLEEHRLLEEEPHIASKLTVFLKDQRVQKLIPLAKFIIGTIERLTFANPNDFIANNSPKVKRKKSKSHKGDLLKLDPPDLAEQLSVFEHKLYSKITPQELLAHPKFKPGSSPATNLTNFCATYDQLAFWVKTSVLNEEQLGRRSNAVDFWIKVAEKCKNLNNFASMSSIINALSSSDITRLHLTWAHINRKSPLDALLKFNDPSNKWAGYRGLIADVPAGSQCVPFIGMYLTDIVHIADSFKDSEEQGICYLQRQRWFEVITNVLKFQNKSYAFAEGSTQTLIKKELNMATYKDSKWFYARSQEVQHSELANADIRKGLEAAGF
ncbi:ras guanine nucleotide exchange factor domain-containing protein [Flagelloscypha sp. PMI_526]|nr:ras guanine nucleotide exchange factor domain-containing protein [Flagelloscypha sp. PMI_526]